MSGCCIVTPGPGGGGGTIPSTLGLEEYVTEQDDTVFSTNSGVFVSTGKALVTPVIPAGDYRIGVYYQASCTIIGEGHWRVRLDGTSNVWPSDHIEEFNTDDVIEPAYRSRVITLTNAAHTFTLETRQTGNETTTTRSAYFELWRVPPTVDGDNIDPCVCESQDELDNFALTTTPVNAGRTFATPNLVAGTYRLALSFNYDRLVCSNGFLYNIRNVTTGTDLYPTAHYSLSNGGGTDKGQARYIVRELALPAGITMFDLRMSADLTVDLDLKQTTWELHKVP